MNFLKYASGEEAHKELCKNAGLVPFVTPVTEDPEFTGDKFCAASMEYLDDVQIFPVVKYLGGLVRNCMASNNAAGNDGRD